MKIYAIAILLLSLSIFSCSHDDGGGQDPNAALRAEAQNDRDSLANVGSGFSALDTKMQANVSTFFGGNDGPTFQRFLDERIHFFMSQDEYANLLDNTFGGKFGSSKSKDSSDQAMKSANAVVGAANVGTILWLYSSLEGNKTLDFSFRGQNVTMNSPHVGLMLIGEAYDEFYKDQNGNKHKVPAASRQAILIHEARHSDCPTGLSPKDLDYIRSITSLDDLGKNPDTKTCGNLHSNCPADHEFPNLPACDKMAWGAYAAGSMFAALASKGEDTTEVGRYLLEMTAADQLSRLLFDTDDMFDGKMGPPNLTSQGLVDSTQ